MSDRSRWRSRPGLLGVLVLTALLAGCDDGVTFHLDVRVGLSVSPDHASSGLTVSFTFRNDGEERISAAGKTFEFVVREDGGGEIQRVAGSASATTLEAEESVSALWDQHDSEGHPAGPGAYTVTVAYKAAGASLTRTAHFTID